MTDVTPSAPVAIAAQLTPAQILALIGGAAGTATANLAAVLGASQNLDQLGLPVGGLKIGATGSEVTVDATAAELNRAAKLSTREVAVTAATLAVTAAAHSDRTVVLDRAAGIAATLPAASGSGARYRFFVKTTFTSNATIAVANSSDTISGVVGVLGSAAAAFATVSGQSDTITFNGSTTGGLTGTWVELEDVAANLWSVKGFLNGSGTAATPFSAAV